MIYFDADLGAVWVTPQLATVAVTGSEFVKDLISDFFEFFSFNLRLSKVE
jgi:hypothetical protein